MGVKETTNLQTWVKCQQERLNGTSTVPALSVPVGHPANDLLSTFQLGQQWRRNCLLCFAASKVLKDHGERGRGRQQPRQALERAYLQKWKAKRGLQGLPGLDGVGLRLRGVRLKVKIMSFQVREMVSVKIAQLIERTMFPLGQNCSSKPINTTGQSSHHLSFFSF